MPRRGASGRPQHVPNLEETEDAVVDGDVPFLPGSARAALRHRAFRLVWAGSLASNIGTWMQNVALGAFAYDLTKSSGYVALLGFAQLGPLLALAILGGLLADTIDRRWLLIACQAEQMVLSFVLALAAAVDHPSRTVILLVVLALGIGNALNAPTFSAVLPELVSRRDLAGAVSLQSVQMNLSRVIGPAIGGIVLPAIGAPGVFAVNGLTYLFAIATLWMVAIPRPAADLGGQGIRRLAGGLRIARRDRLVRRCLMTIAAISFFCLPFIGLMPVVAAKNLGMDVTEPAYGILYASFGLGAAIGAGSIGTFLLGRSRVLIVRGGLALFSLALAAFALVRHPAPAYPLVLLVGVFYFGCVTALSTILQDHLSDAVRGRVTALWIMGFGGTVPLGLLAGGFAADHTSVTAVVVAGAVVGLVLALVADVRSPDPAAAE